MNKKIKIDFLNGVIERAKKGIYDPKDIDKLMNMIVVSEILIKKEKNKEKKELLKQIKETAESMTVKLLRLKNSKDIS